MKIDVESLRHLLPEKRWFSDKGREIAAVDVVDQAIVEEADGTVALVIARVTFTSGPDALYHLPVIVDGEGHVRDASEDPQRLRVLGDMLAHGHPVKGEHGIFHFSGPGLDPAHPPGLVSVSTIGAEQSNTSVVLDDAVILKFFRKVEPGPNPDLELSRLLTNEGFRFIPEQLGEIFYESSPDREVVPEEAKVPDIDLGMAQRFLSGARQGWDIALDHLGHLFDQIHDEDVGEDIPALIEERAAPLLNAIDQLGDVTAALHVTLAREELEPELRPEVITSDDLYAWIQSTRANLARTAPRSDELTALSEEIDARLDRFEELQEAGMMTRIHGDYHLGQVLREPRLWHILDFEGEPARTLEERRAKHSPLKDVAGMLRSLSYVAHVALLPHPGDERRERWAHAWEEIARSRFLTAYLAKAYEGRFLPPEEAVTATLLDYLELDKAIYEIGYELSARPDWVSIPLRGIRRIVTKDDER